MLVNVLQTPSQLVMVNATLVMLTDIGKIAIIDRLALTICRGRARNSDVRALGAHGRQPGRICVDVFTRRKLNRNTVSGVS